MKRIFLAILALMLVSTSLIGQNNRFKRKGDRHFDRLAYSKAIDQYLKALRKDEDPEVILRLAESYRLTKNYPKAARWYEEAMKLDYQPSITRYHYAHTLLQQGRIEEAKDMFESYSMLEPDDPRGENYANALGRFDELLADSIFYTIENLPVNGKNSDFGAWNYNGHVIFASSRKEGSVVYQNFDWLDAPFLSFYHSRPKGQDTTGWSIPKPLKGEINSRYHESSFTRSDSMGRTFFTRNNYFEKKKGLSENGIILLKIYSAEMNGWEATNVQEFPYNSDNYSMTHPCLTPDGQNMYLVSDMPGGFGGKDIYKSQWRNGSWTEPVNLGPVVNTPGDEMFPFIHPDGTLFFSSDGHPGLGHLDLFSIRLNAVQPQVVNMGAPLNSPYDDFAINVNDEKNGGYISSNRPGGKGDDDIYSFTMLRPRIEIKVLDSVAQLPIENAEITVNDHQTLDQFIFVTDSSGEISFQTDFGGDFDAVVQTLEFEDESLVMDTRSENGQLVFRYEVQLYNPPPAITALVIDETSQERLPGATVDIIKLLTEDTIPRVADRNGRIAVKLEENTYYEIQVKAEGYLNYVDRFSTTQWALDGDTIIPMKLMKLDLNKPIVLENIHYDFDRFYIREDAYGDLKKVAKIMRDNPRIVIELSSHTDSRGTDTYNEWLSHMRAVSAKNFLLNIGITQERIIAKGYGEYRLVNQCRDGVPCTDDEHFQNRRTEFKIIGFIDDIDLERSRLATDERTAELPPDYDPENRGDKPASILYPGGWVKKGPPENDNWNPINTRNLPKKEPKEEKQEDEKKPEVKTTSSDTPPSEENSGLDHNPQNMNFENSADLNIERQRHGSDHEPEEQLPEGKVIHPEHIDGTSRDGGVGVAEPGRSEELYVTEEEPFGAGDLPDGAVGENDPFDSGESSVMTEGDNDLNVIKTENTLLPDFKYDPAGSDTLIYFKVNLGSFKGKLGDAALDRLQEFRPYVESSQEMGLNAYRVGDYLDYQTAEAARDKIRTYGFGAFISVWKEGEPMSFIDLKN